MRALTISSHGTLDRVDYRDELPIPELSRPTDVRIRVSAAALNHLDLFVVSGLPGVNITPPWILGADASGVIDQVGTDVSGLSEGDHVIVNPGISDRTCEYCLAGEQPLCPRFALLGEHLPGTMAEYVVVPAANVRAIPAGTSSELAAAFTLATLTAWRMLVTRAQLRAGEDVLIWGIGGGVALAALQICKLIGARAWVVSSSAEKLRRAAELGAHELLDRTKVDVARAIRDRTKKRGMDVVVDNVGEATWNASLQALGRRGRLVTCGATSGPIVETDVRRLFWNQWSILGSTMGNDAEFDAIAEHFRAGRLQPVIDCVFNLEHGRAAMERLQSAAQFGKIVVRVS
ncbi:MAG TPA: zinc-binding dehydrogenase [Gemmatimonadaceae bacterium]|nr:zinc-binding dehydrogenase [Gemmatimonadaceae bacterium]